MIYHMIFSQNNTNMGVTSEAGSTYSYGALEFTPIWQKPRM